MKGYVGGGVGFPELVRAEAGLFYNRRISMELLLGLPSPDLATEFPNVPGFSELTVLVGPAVTGWLVGYCDGMRPPVHSLLVSTALRFNVLDPLRLEADGDKLGLTGEIMLGYGLITEDLLVMRAQASLMLYGDDGFTVGPNIVVTVGKAFD